MAATNPRARAAEHAPPGWRRSGNGAGSPRATAGRRVTPTRRRARRRRWRGGRRAFGRAATGCVAAHAAAGRRAGARTSTSSSRPSSSTLNSAKPAGVSNRRSMFAVATAADAFRPRLPGGSPPRSATRRARATRRGAAATHARSRASGAQRARTLAAKCHVIGHVMPGGQMLAFTARGSAFARHGAVSRTRRRTAARAAWPRGSRGAGPEGSSGPPQASRRRAASAPEQRGARAAAR